MLTRNRFSALSESLSSGFFADNAVLVLSKAKRGLKLSKEDTPVIKEISTFLEDVLKGYAWTDNPRFSSRSATSASAFSQAVNVTFGQGSESFSRMMNEHLRLTKKLLKKEQVDQTSLQGLIDFFTAMSRSQLENTDNIINVRTSYGARRMFSL